MKCYNCGATSNLRMHPLKHEDEEIEDAIGFLFVCIECYRKGLYFDIDWSVGNDEADSSEETN